MNDYTGAPYNKINGLRKLYIIYKKNYIIKEAHRGLVRTREPAETSQPPMGLRHDNDAQPMVARGFKRALFQTTNNACAEIRRGIRHFV